MSVCRGVVTSAWQHGRRTRKRMTFFRFSTPEKPVQHAHTRPSMFAQYPLGTLQNDDEHISLIQASASASTGPGLFFRAPSTASRATGALPCQTQDPSQVSVQQACRRRRRMKQPGATVVSASCDGGMARTGKVSTVEQCTTFVCLSGAAGG